MITTVFTMLFNYASAQMEPKTSQGNASDTVAVPTPRKANDQTTIANKGILKRNTIEAGTGRPDPIKKDIKTNQPIPPLMPQAKSRVEAVVDTITPKSKK